jgi:hypothetical protein
LTNWLRYESKDSSSKGALLDLEKTRKKRGKATNKV